MNPMEIEGWMTEMELTWLARYARRSNIIVEVGVWFGRSTYVMAQKVRKKIIAIDSFVGEGVPIRFEQRQVAQREMVKDPDWIYHQCLENLSEFIELGKVEVIKARSCDAIKELDSLKGLVDMVFIDASHDYESVKEDILNYRPLLREGGLLCGHDYTIRPVRKAVWELVPTHKHARHTSIWTN